MLDRVLRAAILTAADSPAVRGLVRRYGMQLGAARFVAGETLDECVGVLGRLAGQGLHSNTTLLGEGVHDPAEAAAVAEEYVGIVARLAQESLPTNVALKLTHLGLELGEDVAFANIAKVVDAAAEAGSFVRIDMEQSSFVDATLRTYRRLRESGRENVGTVLQSYLYRSEDDLRALLELRPNLRIVKGAYLEPPELAYPQKQDVDAAYVRMTMAAMRGGAYTAVATHDDRIIEGAIGFAERHSVPRERFELQLLYGVRPQLQLGLARRGFKVRVATPFGPEWYPYLMRRLAERPANVLFFARSLVRR